MKAKRVLFVGGPIHRQERMIEDHLTEYAIYKEQKDTEPLKIIYTEMPDRPGIFICPVEYHSLR